MTADVVSVPVDRITPNPDYQPRAAGLSEAHIRLLAESDPQTWPPVIVAPNASGGFDLIDGFHRYEAARRMKWASLTAMIEPNAGYPESVAANLHHGLPLALADRKDAARWWAEQEPAMSYREIGRRVGLSDKTVKRSIEHDDAAAPQASERPDPIRRLVALAYSTYRDRHGRTAFGFGKDGNPSAFRKQLDRYEDGERPAVAQALAAFGRACLDAAAPYIGEGR